MSSLNKQNLKRFAKKNFKLDGKTIIKELRDNVPTVGSKDLCHLSKVVYHRFNYKMRVNKKKNGTILTIVRQWSTNEKYDREQRKRKRIPKLSMTNLIRHFLNLISVPLHLY